MIATSSALGYDRCPTCGQKISQRAYDSTVSSDGNRYHTYYLPPEIEPIPDEPHDQEHIEWRKPKDKKPDKENTPEQFKNYQAHGWRGQKTWRKRR